MGKLIYFILGIIVGVILTFLVLKAIDDYIEEEVDNPYHIQGLRMLETEGECITSKPIKVFQVLSDNSALAEESSFPELNLYGGKTVLILNDNGQTYYDDQIIEPKKCFRQYGIMKYETNDGTWKTVPAIKTE